MLYLEHSKLVLLKRLMNILRRKIGILWIPEATKHQAVVLIKALFTDFGMDRNNFYG